MKTCVQMVDRETIHRCGTKAPFQTDPISNQPLCGKHMVEFLMNMEQSYGINLSERINSVKKEMQNK